MRAELLVREIFLSVQGESSFAGLPCVFVRLTGCPLRCRWCDTQYAYSGGERMSLDEVLAAVTAYGVEHVELTGGEPLAQPQSIALMRQLVELGKTVLLETSGALSIAEVDPRVHVIMDIKCPDSGMNGRMDWANLERLTERTQLKFVLASRGDYEYARDLVRLHELNARCAEVLFSVAFGELEPREVVQWMLEDGLDLRFQLQMHKFIWDPDTPGV